MEYNLYFDYLPDELLGEILLYLGPFDILYLSESINTESVICSKIFWINKLSYTEMEEYIPFLSLLKDRFLDEYFKILEIDEKVQIFIDMLERNEGFLLLKTINNIGLKQLIDYHLNEFKSEVTFGKYGDGIQIYYKKQIYYKNVNSSKVEKLSNEEFKLLIIKLLVSDFKLYEMSNLYEIYD